jgi:hypothetical protein
MVSFIIVGQPLMTQLPAVPIYDPTAILVNQGLIVIFRQ